MRHVLEKLALLEQTQCCPDRRPRYLEVFAQCSFRKMRCATQPVLADVGKYLAGQLRVQVTWRIDWRYSPDVVAGAFCVRMGPMIQRARNAMRRQAGLCSVLVKKNCIFAKFGTY
jgi:hypothetical protein